MQGVRAGDTPIQSSLHGETGGANQGGEWAGPTDSEGYELEGCVRVCVYSTLGGGLGSFPQAYCFVSLSLEENRVLVFLGS